jgi:hypothetical protein
VVTAIDSAQFVTSSQRHVGKGVSDRSPSASSTSQRDKKLTFDKNPFDKLAFEGMALAKKVFDGKSRTSHVPKLLPLIP